MITNKDEPIQFFENGRTIKKIQDEASKNCKHEITAEIHNDIRYRFCKHCGMSAHADERYDYLCGLDWCRCCN